MDMDGITYRMRPRMTLADATYSPGSAELRFECPDNVHWCEVRLTRGALMNLIASIDEAAAECADESERGAA